MSNAVKTSGSGESPVDYEAIERAVMESSRGRWFLEEYARRLRRNETGNLLQAIGKLETVIADSQDALTERLSRALGVIVPAISVSDARAIPAQPESALTPRQMKHFRQDEDIFVHNLDSDEPHAAIVRSPALTAALPEVAKGAKLVIRRIGEATAEQAEAEEAKAAVAELPREAIETPPAAALSFNTASNEAAKRRIVIIRHKPGEYVDVPLQNEQAAAG